MKLLPVLPLVASTVVGVLTLVMGLAINPMFNAILRSQFPEKVPLSNHSMNLDLWKNPKSSVDAHIMFYFFDIVNVEDVKKGAKPKLREIGPYVYDEDMIKESVRFEENDTVFYREVKTMRFNPKLTKGTENDTFTTINIPLMTAVTMAEPYGDLAIEGLQIALDLLFPNETLFKTVSVYEILWGYKDPILSDISKLTTALNISLPIPAGGIFGFFYQKNNTDDGVYSVHTGRANLNHYMNIATYNGSSSLPFWSSKYCNMLNGTDGTMYHPFIDKDETLFIFSSEMCRSLPLVYKDTFNFNNSGISTYRFETKSNLFSYAPDNTDNQCFCVTGNCPQAGVMDLSKCQQGAPVFLSQPHFLNGPYYQSQVEGLSPDNSIHGTYLDVEPTLGVVLSAAQRIQMSLDVHPNRHLREAAHIPKLLLPLLWLQGGATLNAHGMKLLNDQFFGPLSTIHFLHWFMLFAGIAILLVCIAYTVHWRLKLRKAARQESSPKPDENSSLIINGSDQNYQTDASDTVRDAD